MPVESIASVTPRPPRQNADEELLMFHVGSAKKIVAIGVDFLADYDPPTLRENLTAWNVAHLSRTLERGCRLHVTSTGPEEVRD